MNNIIVAFFIYNSWKSPERYGAGNDRNEEAEAAPLQQKRELAVQVHELKTIHIVSSEKYEQMMIHAAQKEKEKELPTLPEHVTVSMHIENGYAFDRESQRDIEILDNNRWA